MRIVTLITAVIATLFFGMIAGFFYAFSVDVMPALDRLQPDNSILAMQSINETVRNPVFFLTFFFTPVCGLLAALMIWKTAGAQSAILMMAAALVYFFAAFLPTAMVNVPMNEALALLDTNKETAELMDVWKTYSDRWTLWNTVRTVTSGLALCLSVVSVFFLGRSFAK